MSSQPKIYTFPVDCCSLVAKYLDSNIYKELIDLKTSNGVTLNEIIRSAAENLDSRVGVYAGDKESYSLFSKLLNPIIEDYHGFSQTDDHVSNLEIKDIDETELDRENEYILSTRIRVARNLNNYPLGGALNKDQRLDIEKKITEALHSFTGNLAGKYYSLGGMSEQDQLQMITDHFLFKNDDRFLESAGLNRDWPSGRGIFHNLEKTFLIWVNEEDQLRIISMQKGGGVKEVLERLINAITMLEKELDFSHDEHLGYITSCPSNLGTAMRASVHIKLPKLSLDSVKLNEICNQFYLQIRGVHGEHSKSEGSVFDISNKRRLGVSEVTCVNDLINGVRALINTEKSLNVI